MKNNKKKNKAVILMINLVVILVLLALDQLSKYAVVQNLKNQASIPLIDGVLELHYLENHGAAFGILQNQKLLFIFIAVIILTIVGYVLVKLPLKKKFISWQVFLCLIAAGGIGNMIDRIVNNYVIDFIYFSLIDFPIFNVADIYITCGTFLLLFVILFGVKDEELEFLKLKIGE